MIHGDDKHRQKTWIEFIQIVKTWFVGYQCEFEDFCFRWTLILWNKEKTFDVDDDFDVYSTAVQQFFHFPLHKLLNASENSV